MFFQACSNVLGFDWNSSDSTAVTASVLKRAFDQEELGVKVAGGKEERSKRAPKEIAELSDQFNLTSNKIDRMIYAIRMTAKGDNATIQAGCNLYHHAFFISEEGEWTVV